MKKIILICVALIFTTGITLAQDENSKVKEKPKKEQKTPGELNKKRAVKQKMKARAKISKIEKKANAIKTEIKADQEALPNLEGSAKKEKEAVIEKSKKKLKVLETKIAALRAKHMKAKSN